MRDSCCGSTVSWASSVGLLALRFVMGAAFILHGWPKIQDPWAWMGPEATMPNYLQAAAAVAEFGGGIALILGLLTRVAALGLAIVMAVAITTVHLKLSHPFVSATGGPSHELAAIYLACALLLLLSGPGLLALDALLFGRCCRSRAMPSDVADE